MICCGVIGKCGDMVGVCTEPVTAQEMMIFFGRAMRRLLQGFS
jgi:hypothetical protein